MLCTNKFDATKKRTVDNVQSAIVAALETLAIKEATAGSVVFTTGTVEVNKFHEHYMYENIMICFHRSTG